MPAIDFDEPLSNLPVSTTDIMGGGKSTALVNGESTADPLSNFAGAGGDEFAQLYITPYNNAGENGLFLKNGDGDYTSTIGVSGFGGGNIALYVSTDEILVLESGASQLVLRDDDTLDAGGIVATFNGVEASTFTGSLVGNAATATDATNVVVSTIGADTTAHVALFGDATGTLSAYTDTGLTYNASTNNLTANIFTGSLVGNATSATNAGNLVVSTIGADTTAHVALFGDATGTIPVYTDTGIVYNASTNHISSKFIASAGSATAGSAGLKLTSGTVMTTPEVGAVEYDGIGLYQTFNTTMGREVVQAYNQYKIPDNQTGITTLQSFFYDGANNNYIPLLPSTDHLIEMELNWSIAGSGIQTATVDIVFTFVATSSPLPTSWRTSYDGSSLLGTNQATNPTISPSATAALGTGRINADHSGGGSTTLTLNFPTLAHTTSHRGLVRMLLTTPANASPYLKTTIAVTAGSATVATLRTSIWRCFVIPPNTGAYV